MTKNWTAFFPEKDEKVAEFHETFQQELNDQLFEKGHQTGIRAFDKHGFYLLIGLDPIELEKRDHEMFARVNFGLPPAFSFDSWISWKYLGSKDISIEELHKITVSAIDIEFSWDSQRFPLEAVSEYLKPTKRSKTPKNNLLFDVDYYPNALPDLELIVYPGSIDIDELGKLLYNETINFSTSLANKTPDKSFQLIGNPISEKNCSRLILDIGTTNSMRTVNQLFKHFSEQFGESISKVELK